MCECGSLDFKVVVLKVVDYIDTTFKKIFNELENPGVNVSEHEVAIYDVAVAYVRALEDFHLVCHYLHDKIISAILDSFYKKYNLFKDW